MPRYALLLRGVNVGGHGRLAMADLRALLESLGHTGVTTYLQSGNAVVTSDVTEPDQVAAQVENELAEQAGLHTRVLARTAADLTAVIDGNPYPDAVAGPALLHVLFLSARPEQWHVSGVDPAAYAPDEFRLGERVIYLRFAESAGRSRLPPALGRQLTKAVPGLVVTARNWNTVRRLAEMTAG